MNKHFIVNGVEFTMRHIPGGIFMMGATPEQIDAWSDEKPAHLVRVPDFWLGETPVTQVLYEAVMGNNPSYFQGDSELPVEQVNWKDVQRFCQNLKELTGENFRLPSEAEWEYAAREGGKAVLFGNGKNVADPSEMNFDASDIWKTPYSVVGVYRQKTTPVKTFEPNIFGLYDMSGNVWELCQDCWHDDYNGAPTDGSAWGNQKNSSNRVNRGGSWCNDPRYCRVSCRSLSTPDDCDNNLGFRLAF